MVPPLKLVWGASGGTSLQRVPDLFGREGGGPLLQTVQHEEIAFV